MERAITPEKRTEEKYRGLLECAPDAIVIINEQGTIVLVNTQAEELFGYSRDELVGENVEILVPEHLRDQHRTAYFSNPHTRPMGGGLDLYARRKDGETFPAEISLGFFESEEGMLVVSTIRDITERKREEARLVRLATHDSVTGLFNRSHFQAKLGDVLAQALRYETRGALLLLDLDEFKNVNDRFGHRTGDQLLADVAGVLERRLRRTDIAARLGGDEFAILLAQADEHQASIVAKEILKRMRDLTVGTDEEPMVMTTSIGIVLFPKHGVTAEGLLAHADIAMYEAKARGRNCARIYRFRKRPSPARSKAT